MQRDNSFIHFILLLGVVLLTVLSSGCHSTGATQPTQVFRPPMMGGNLSGYAPRPNAGFAGYPPQNAGAQQGFAARFNPLQPQQAGWGGQGGFNPFGFGKTTC